MAMELLFENHTQLDEDVIQHIIKKNYKRPEKAKQYHVMTLLVGILAALAAVYFGRLGILTHQMLTLLCTIALTLSASIPSTATTRTCRRIRSKPGRTPTVKAF